MAEWSKAVVSGTILFGGVGSNPTPCIFFSDTHTGLHPFFPHLSSFFLLFVFYTTHAPLVSETVWPSGLRRVTRNHFSSGGVGSNPAAVVFLFDDTDHDYPRLSHDLFEASLAQSVERAALNRTVVGSSPTGSVFYSFPFSFFFIHTLSCLFLFFPLPHPVGLCFFLMLSYSEVSWCSWLSHHFDVVRVPGSSPGETTFFDFPF